MPLTAAVSFDIASAALCTALILARIVYRLLFRCKVHTTCHRRWRIDDAYMAFALLPLLGRTITITTSFRLNPSHSSAPVTAAQAAAAGLTVEAMTANRVDALRLVLPARICYALFLWSLKLSLLCFYARFVDIIDWGHTAVRVLRGLIIATFVAILIVTLTECRPLHLAWQLAPPEQRHSCARGLGNLLTMAVSNIITDLALIILPFPILRLVRLDRRAKIQLTVLFGIGLLVVVITILRIPLILVSSISQRSRSMWASIEILCACIVANTSFFYALVKDCQGRHDRTNKAASPFVPQAGFYLQNLPSSSQQVDMPNTPAPSLPSEPPSSAKQSSHSDDRAFYSQASRDLV
ncbi:hypothetical protein S7711_01825 [Stachybotrys chartarum IBT 7711]|uniref:Rhodopsin domain-containing protein n=1 Tax=Stachybotrys chartarum (strain CBS 109288 / IBT 7711) TaxID=1280523 RepID=A0A084AJ29_STACB|nr:hypothetical protein S7711_01825 [Stachybotrys chartarum IBT 7711]